MSDNDVGTATHHAPRSSCYWIWNRSAPIFGSSSYQGTFKGLRRVLPQGNVENHLLWAYLEKRTAFPENIIFWKEADISRNVEFEKCRGKRVWKN